VSRRGRGEGGLFQYETKQGIRWAVTYRVPDPERGGTKPKREGGLRTKRAATARLREVLGEVERGDYVAASGMTFRDYAEDWLTRAGTRLRPSTLHSYRRNLTRLVYPALGHLPVQQVETRHLDRLYADLLDHGRNDGQGLSPTTVRYVHTIVGAVLGDAEKRGVVRKAMHANAAVPTKRGKASTLRTWDGATIAAFLTATADDRRSPLWRLLFSTGLRRGEALGIGWEHLDLDAGTLRVARSLVDVDWGRPVYAAPKTAHGLRTIHLDPATVAALRTLRAQQAQERLLFGAGYADQGLVFCREDGAPLHPDRISKAFQEQAQRHGLPVIRLHDCRHSWATLALANGVPVKVVQERLGHAHPSITLGIYTHVTPGMDAEAAATVANLFG